MSREIDPLVVGRVIGDVLEMFNPSVTMRVTFSSNTIVSNGHELAPSLLQSKPRVEVGGQDLRSFFTLIMIDPDAPSPSNPYMREYLHWMVTDIPGTTDASFGREIVRYEAPKPVAGIHRYIFVLFKQSGRQTVSAAPETRECFNTNAFSSYFGLSLPVAAVYFNAQRETAPRRRSSY
ncbi:PREDICTED: protein BROTHER of FT and TFL 1 [Camelina sativa]|uniref:Protein BROTHER of FT and TFL 1 n=1 Tax=Camelina sativa TaxID=90675 RepID=A0ABM0UP72_CAMSA|nr:PREDICTED: protein BROTHER of FT and TFL 1 [Camelina sativa]